MSKKKLPIGIEDFEEIITEDFYYVDKTGLIRELLNNWGKVNLFIRPRRFGKTLNMSMLKCFFEAGEDKGIFEGLEISKETALCKKYMGQFPVIFVSLKSVNGENFESACSMMRSEIGMAAMRFQFLLKSEMLTERERGMYDQLTTIGGPGREMFVMEDAVLKGSLKTLSGLLEKHYGRKAVLLIDEYDVPLAKAFENGYYDEMADLIRNLFEQVLKTNASLQFAVLTGCMRISKESIFTGLNNLKVLSITDAEFDEYFGFTDEEVRNLLSYYDCFEKYDDVKNWYDGYQFGNVGVYCPWDVINYCDALRTDTSAQPKNYWINTSSNDVVQKFIRQSDNNSIKREIEGLVAGEIIAKEIRQDITYKTMYDSIENIWSVLFTTGYLTQRGAPFGRHFQLAIPNMEVRDIFTTQIMELFKENVGKNGDMLNQFCDALKAGDAKGVEKYFGDYLKKTISIRDTFVKKQMKENFYHGILLGILGFKAEWVISSNKESGDGYGDILIEIDGEGMGIVLEVKYAHDGNLDAACRQALKQVQDTHYEEELMDEGIDKIFKYGIACYKKRCKVMVT